MPGRRPSDPNGSSVRVFIRRGGFQVLEAGSAWTHLSDQFDHAGLTAPTEADWFRDHQGAGSPNVMVLVEASN